MVPRRPARRRTRVARPRTASPGYHSGMSHRVTLIPGDGIGPELAEATRRVLDASGVSFDWEVVDAGEAVMAKYGTPLPEHVLESITQRRHANRNHVDAIEEVFAKMSALDLVAELAIGRAHQTEVDPSCAATDRLDLAFLQRAEQLDLNTRADLGDFVEEQRTAVGLDEPPFPRSNRAGERTFLVPE